MVSLHIKTARFKSPGHKNELCFFWDTLLFKPILRFCSDVLKVQALLVVASKCVRSQSLAFNWAPRENWPCFCLILNFWPQCNITFRYNMQSRQHDLRKPQTPVSFVLWLVFAMSQLCWLFTCSHICASGWSADDQQISLLLIRISAISLSLANPSWYL